MSCGMRVREGEGYSTLLVISGIQLGFDRFIFVDIDFCIVVIVVAIVIKTKDFFLHFFSVK